MLILLLRTFFDVYSFFLCNTKEKMKTEIEQEKERLEKKKRKGEKAESQSGAKRSKTSPSMDAGCTGSKPSNA